jgi:RHS repeat-associated protein
LLWSDTATDGDYFLAYDGNGNVKALVNTRDGSNAATYEYGPFGDLIRATGPAANHNPFRFSTKYQDETCLLYYGYRYYDPLNGRWDCRDSLGERGGQNLFASFKNDSVNTFDPSGKSNANDPPFLNPNGTVYYDPTKPFQWHHPIT